MTKGEFSKRIDCYVDVEEGDKWESNGLSTLAEAIEEAGLKFFDLIPDCPDKVLALRHFEDFASRAYKALRFGSL